MRNTLRIAAVAVASALALTLTPTIAHSATESVPAASAVQPRDKYREDRVATSEKFQAARSDARAIAYAKGRSVPFTEADLRKAIRGTGIKYAAGQLTMRGKYDLYRADVNFTRGTVSEASSVTLLMVAEPAAWAVTKAVHAGEGTLEEVAARVQSELQDVKTEFGKIRVYIWDGGVIHVTFSSRKAPVFGFGAITDLEKPQMILLRPTLKSNLK